MNGSSGIDLEIQLPESSPLSFFCNFAQHPERTKLVRRLLLVEPDPPATHFVRTLSSRHVNLGTRHAGMAQVVANLP